MRYLRFWKWLKIWKYKLYYSASGVKGIPDWFQGGILCLVCAFQGKSNTDLRLHIENEHSPDKLMHTRNYPCKAGNDSC